MTNTADPRQSPTLPPLTMPLEEAMRALSTCYLSTGSTSMKVHDRLGRQSYAAVERRVMSCQVANLFPSS
jgi:hypothetical protein